MSITHKNVASTIVFLIIAVTISIFVIQWIGYQDYRTIFDYWSVAPLTERPLNNDAFNKVSENKEQIKYIANSFGITPIAISGIIITEASLNTGPVNYFEEYYVKTFLLSKSNDYLETLADATSKDLADKKLSGESEQEFQFRIKRGLMWSIGLCQISILKARELEPILAKLESRKERTMKEIISSLLVPNENLKYCALELSNIRNQYKTNVGIDISDKPDILATLYNNGKVMERITEYNQGKDKVPTPNDFGQFILSHLKELEQSLV